METFRTACISYTLIILLRYCSIGIVNRTEEEIESARQYTQRARNDNIFERSPRCFVSTGNLGYLSTLIRPSNFHPYNSFKQEENRATNSRIIIINAKRVSEKLWTLLDNFFLSKLVSRILRDSASI